VGSGDLRGRRWLAPPGTLGSAGASSGFGRSRWWSRCGRRRRGRVCQGSIPRTGAFEVARQCLDLGRASWVRARIFRRIRGSVVERLGVRVRALHETLGLGNLRRQAHDRHQIGWRCAGHACLLGAHAHCRAEDHAGGKDRRPHHDWSGREIALPDARLPSIHVTRRLRMSWFRAYCDGRSTPVSRPLRITWSLVGDHERPMTSAAETAILPIDVEVQVDPMCSIGWSLDHDELGSNRSKLINVIDFIELERDAGGKPDSTFPHPALSVRNYPVTSSAARSGGFPA